eukprot:4781867-Pleurochrysis_carterae.AAC.1
MKANRPEVTFPSLDSAELCKDPDVKKKLLKLQSENCDAWEHLNQMELSDISTAALPAGVYTYGETTNNAAEVFMHMAYDVRRQR